MSRLMVFWHRLISPLRRQAREADLNDEIETHLAHLTDEFKGQGLSGPDARAAARRAFGGVEQMKEIYRDQQGWSWLDATLQDIRYAVRMMSRAPGFTAIAVLTLAVGIGGNAAVFSVADAALFRPLPYWHGDHLANVMNVRESMPGIMMSGLPPQKVDAWRGQTQILDGLEAFGSDRVEMSGADDAVWISGISNGLLPLLGVAPAIGRSFTETESATASDVALISHALWTDLFGSSRSVIGSTITLNRRTFSIIGVMPATFRFPNKSVNIWVPWNQTMSKEFLGRIRDGLTVGEAQRQADAIADQIQTDHPLEDGWKIGLMSLDGRRATGTTPMALMTLLGAVGFVLLIACTNVANLLLARAATRQRELAMRSALGASRIRLFRQLLIEGAILAVVAGAAVAVVSVWSIDALGHALPAAVGLQAFDPTLNGRVLAFVGAVTFVTSILCGALPALRATRPSLMETLTVGSVCAGVTPGHRRLHGALIACEVGLTFVLLMGAGLLANSFIRMVRVDVGFDARQLAAVRLQLPDRYRGKPAQETFFAELRTRLQSLPGVRAMTSGSGVPPIDGGGITIDEPRNTISRDRAPIKSQNTLVDSDFFNTLRIPIVEGRPFLNSDSLSASPVVIIDRQLARRLWPQTSAIGRQVVTSRSSSPMTIVGIAGHVKGAQFATDQDRFQYQAYMPLAQQQASATRMLAVRSGGNALTILPAIRAAVRGIDSNVRVLSLATVESSYDAVLSTPRFFLSLMSVFAAAALCLACIGLYGLLAFSVARRTQEMGIRLALGAKASTVTRMVVGEAFLPTAFGLGGGIVAAFYLTRFLGSQLYGIPANDPATMLGVALVLIGTASMAAYLPARRAATVDPIIALRHE